MLPPLPSPIVRNVIYPVYRGLRGDRLLAMLEELEKNQWLSTEELAEIQWRRVEDYLRQITTHVPYYRDLFQREGLAVDDIESPADFGRIPFLAKEDVRGAGEAIVTKDPLRRGISSSTGGSTGEPLHFFTDSAAGPIRRASTLLGLRWAGIDVGDKQAIIWGFHLDRPFRERFANGVKDYFQNIIYLSSFDMSEAAMESYARRLASYKPDLILGYPSAVAQFAEFCRARKIHAIRPRAVISSGEKLFPHQAEVMAEIFQCPLFDRYGSREFATVAQECGEHRGLHLFNEYLFVEVVHESGRTAESGEVGEIVVTDLTNLYMPFLRYRTGDLAVPTARSCACGRGMPLFDRIEGRTFDAVVTADGKSTGGFFWTHLSRAVPGIRQFQIEQRDRDGVIFRIVPGPEWKDEHKAELERKIKGNMGEGFSVTFDVVNEIPLTPAGKYRFISSKLGERLVLKSKIHNARATGVAPDKPDCVIVDEELLELTNLAPFEKVLIVDNANGARVETFIARGKRGSGKIIISGAAAHDIHAGDEIAIMAFTWSDQVRGILKNILVDANNKFVRYLVELPGEKL